MHIEGREGTVVRGGCLNRADLSQMVIVAGATSPFPRAILTRERIQKPKLQLERPLLWHGVHLIMLLETKTLKCCEAVHVARTLYTQRRSLSSYLQVNEPRGTAIYRQRSRVRWRYRNSYTCTGDFTMPRQIPRRGAIRCNGIGIGVKMMEMSTLPAQT